MKEDTNSEDKFELSSIEPETGLLEKIVKGTIKYTVLGYIGLQMLYSVISCTYFMFKPEEAEKTKQEYKEYNKIEKIVYLNHIVGVELHEFLKKNRKNENTRINNY